MSKFYLNTEELVQGEFVPKKVNIAFVFQVNCPGCFIYGIPIINNLYRLFQKDVGFIGVATAFEDFEFNNEANLKLLLNKGTLVGAVKKHYEINYGISAYSEKINFPAAFDKIVPSAEFLNSNKIELMCAAIPNFSSFSETEKEILVKKVKSHYSQVPLVGETFTMNQLQGTPSFIIFDDSYNILGLHFGHISEDVLQRRLMDFLG